MSPKNGPPDRWMDYTPMGERISGTRFVCMKVPLKSQLSRRMSDADKFSCETAIEMAASKGYKLGLVIDLSFTTRYYDPNDFADQNVEHKKIFMPGRELPGKSIIENFSAAVKKFETENMDNENLIAVHCTHGLNRTGYMICRYLIDEKHLSAEDAINAFERARGHKIEREIYLNDLFGKRQCSTPKEHSRRTGENPEMNRAHVFHNDPRLFHHSAWNGANVQNYYKPPQTHPHQREVYQDNCCYMGEQHYRPMLPNMYNFDEYTHCNYNGYPGNHWEDVSSRSGRRPVRFNRADRPDPRKQQYPVTDSRGHHRHMNPAPEYFYPGHGYYEERGGRQSRNWDRRRDIYFS